MSKTSKLFIVGTGGFAREVAALVDDCDEYDNFAGFLDSSEITKTWKGALLMGKPVADVAIFKPSDGMVVVAVADAKLRETIVEKFPEGTRFETLIYPSAIVSRWAKIGGGSIICANCVVTTQVSIGKHAQVNLNSTIGHDCDLGDYLTCAPSVNISGACKFKNGVYIGTGAGVRQGVEITSDVVIGMGSMVIKDINVSGTYVGIPARLLGKKK